MKSFCFAPRYTTLLGAALLLSACGGGGNSSASSSSVATTPLTSTITASNAQQVSASGYSATSSLNTGALSQLSIATAASINTPNMGAIDFALQQVYQLAAHANGGNLVVGISVNQNIPCAISGSSTVSGNLASSSGFSNADTISMTFTNCADSAGTMNGKFSVTFNNMSGIPNSSGAWSGTMNTTFSNLNLILSGGTVTMNGDMSIQISQTNASNKTFSASGNSFQITAAAGGKTRSTTLTSYSLTGSIANGVVTTSTNGTFRGNFNGNGDADYTLKTTKAFRAAVGSSSPTEGTLTITASDKTSVTMTIVSPTSVRIDTDSNGDGVIDSTTTSTLSAFLANI